MGQTPPWVKKGNKYNAIKTKYGLRTYDSKAEAQRASGLDLEIRAGLLLAWVPQPWVDLGGVEYRPDFLVIPVSGEPWFEDVKGKETSLFRAKKKLWKEHGQLSLRVLKKKHQAFEVTEIVTGPRGAQG